MKVTHQEVRMPQTLEQPPRTVHRDTYTFAVALPAVEQYLPFGNMESRNGLPERIEIPLIARVLRVGGLFVHETPVAQHLAHPVRSFGRLLPWAQVPALPSERRAVLWTARRRRA